MMKNLFILLWLYVFLAGCAHMSDHMNNVPSDQLTIAPEKGKALINFMRPSSFGGAIQSTLYDGDAYIGTVSQHTRLCYQAEPGKHMFMVVGESADFMEAELLANRTYYVNVAPRMGWWKARFSLVPLIGKVSQEQIDNWYSSTHEVKVNEKGLEWAKNKNEEIKQKKEEYLPKWLSKSEEDKQMLKADSGK
jgi:hypothetical protein